MPDIFDEVEEDLRAERSRQLMRRWGGVGLGAVVLALAATGGWQAWHWQQQRGVATSANTFLALNTAAAAPGADLPANADGFAALARDSTGGYRTLAQLRAAALKSAAGDLPAALALWDQVANDSGADRLYRDLASLLFVAHGVDSGDPAQLAARIAPLAQAGQPWQAPAREVAALIAIRRGETAEARRLLQALAADGTATPGLRERAQRLAAGLGS